MLVAAVFSIHVTRHYEIYRPSCPGYDTLLPEYNITKTVTDGDWSRIGESFFTYE